jgi:hypothetical protein
MLIICKPCLLNFYGTLVENYSALIKRNGGIMKLRTETFDLAVNGKRVNIKATLYQLHTREVRYRVSINDSPVYIFAWDNELNRPIVKDKSAATATIPDELEMAIGRQLYNQLAAA